MLRVATGAGPGPFLGPGDEACGHGIPLDIRTNALELAFASHPVIERFVLPERLPRAAENLIRPTRGDAFDPIRDATHGEKRVKQHVHMIRHDHECVQSVVIQFGVPPPQ